MNEDQNQRPTRISPRLRIVGISKEPQSDKGVFPSVFKRNDLENMILELAGENAKLLKERNELSAKVRGMSIAPDEVETAINKLIFFLLPDEEPVDESIVDFTGMKQHEILALLVKHSIFEFEAALREAKAENEKLKQKPMDTGEKGEPK